MRAHTPSPGRTSTASLERAASACSLLLLAYFPGYVKARLTEPGASARAAELRAVPAGADPSRQRLLPGAPQAPLTLPPWAPSARPAHPGLHSCRNRVSVEMASPEPAQPEREGFHGDARAQPQSQERAALLGPTRARSKPAGAMELAQPETPTPPRPPCAPCPSGCPPGAKAEPPWLFLVLPAGLPSPLSSRELGCDACAPRSPGAAPSGAPAARTGRCLRARGRAGRRLPLPGARAGGAPGTEGLGRRRLRGLRPRAGEEGGRKVPSPLRAPHGAGEAARPPHRSTVGAPALGGRSRELGDTSGGHPSPGPGGHKRGAPITITGNGRTQPGAPTLPTRAWRHNRRAPFAIAATGTEGGTHRHHRHRGEEVGAPMAAAGTGGRRGAPIATAGMGGRALIAIAATGVRRGDTHGRHRVRGIHIVIAGTGGEGRDTPMVIAVTGAGGAPMAVTGTGVHPRPSPPPGPGREGRTHRHCRHRDRGGREEPIAIAATGTGSAPTAIAATGTGRGVHLRPSRPPEPGGECTYGHRGHRDREGSAPTAIAATGTGRGGRPSPSRPPGPGREGGTRGHRSAPPDGSGSSAVPARRGCARGTPRRALWLRGAAFAARPSAARAWSERAPASILLLLCHPPPPPAPPRGQGWPRGTPGVVVLQRGLRAGGQRPPDYNSRQPPAAAARSRPHTPAAAASVSAAAEPPLGSAHGPTRRRLGQGALPGPAAPDSPPRRAGACPPRDAAPHRTHRAPPGPAPPRTHRDGGGGGWGKREGSGQPGRPPPAPVRSGVSMETLPGHPRRGGGQRDGGGDAGADSAPRPARGTGGTCRCRRGAGSRGGGDTGRCAAGTAVAPGACGVRRPPRPLPVPANRAVAEEPSPGAARRTPPPCSGLPRCGGGDSAAFPRERPRGQLLSRGGRRGTGWERGCGRGLPARGPPDTLWEAAGGVPAPWGPRGGGSRGGGGSPRLWGGGS
ncbi:collagen alpha-1(III) chain-like [Cuculus canorus]|uniref:collagen alpha-1(III) chain-like n=1 Tax=Cuculus canorus TaxID=55661 RepID=UPI0023AA44E9|nr:collagen alpha-1(III) chain-like [Cuculus canorus]